MGQIVKRVHFVDKQMLDRLSTVAMLALFGSGLTACIVGALTYDIGRLFRLGG